MLIIDSLSVATNGFQESGIVGPVTPGPKISSPRDELRIATHGWIIVDFNLIPDPGTVICIELVDDGATSCIVDNPFTAANIVPGTTDALLEPERTDAKLEPGPTDFNVQEQC